jgi:mannose-1-phosphate guanylyltransferase
LNQKSSCQRPERAAVVLAGGEGSRLCSLTRKIAGHDVPKQFCNVLGEESLLEQTLRRISPGIEQRLTLVAVSRDHERFYSPILAAFPEKNLVVQPDNRGTAPAILYSLLRLTEIAPQARVAIFPSDHFVSDDQEFMRHVEVGFAAVAQRPELTVLLGIVPEWPETAYGWVEPGTEIGGTCVYEVRRFWEKPAPELASLLMHCGCLWNSFVMVGQLSTLLGLFLVTLPELYRSFQKIGRVETACEPRIIERLYAGLRSTDFSQRVLAQDPINLSVLPVRGVEWSDLGEPQRVMEIIARTGIRPRWIAA